MLSKCANPDCPTSFRYLHEGKLFRIDMKPGAAESLPTSITNGAAKKPPRRIEFFWLCQTCAAEMTLSFQEGHGVTVRPLTSIRAIAS